MRQFILKYGKSIVAAFGAGIYALQAAITDGHISMDEYVGIVVAILAVYGVWKAPANKETTTPN